MGEIDQAIAPDSDVRSRTFTPEPFNVNEPTSAAEPNLRVSIEPTISAINKCIADLKNNMASKNRRILG